MKKTTAIILAFIMIIAVLASCGRRDQYRDPVGTETNAETTSPTTNAVTDQPDNPDETTGQDTESGTTPVNPGNSPSPEGTGNPYAGMSKDDLLALYQHTPERATYSSDQIINTPYYYIRTQYNPGGRAYSKLTGNYVTLCKELACRHDDCVFSGQPEECVIIGDRIYLAIRDYFNEWFRLYSFNYMLDDAELIYEWNYADEPYSFGVYEGKIYMASKVLSDSTHVRNSLFVLDPIQKTYDYALGEDFIFGVCGIGVSDGCIYYTAIDGALWKYDFKNGTHTCLLDASLLNPEEGDVRFHALNVEGPNHIRVVRQSVQVFTYFYYDLTTGEIITEESLLGEDKANLVWTSTAQYLLIKHNTPAYEDDPHYTYYNDKVENWLVNYSGGEIWFRPDSNSELSLLVSMQTDGIPDAIYWVGATDGKTLVVSYKTYKDFENVYNDYNKLTSGDSLRYAVIDLETGTVYK